MPSIQECRKQLAAASAQDDACTGMTGGYRNPAIGRARTAMARAYFQLAKALAETGSYQDKGEASSCIVSSVHIFEDLIEAGYPLNTELSEARTLLRSMAKS